MFSSTRPLAPPPSAARPECPTATVPNPASASFWVQLPDSGSKAAVSASLGSPLGQPARTQRLSAGVYTLRLTVDGTPVTRKVVE